MLRVLHMGCMSAVVLCALRLHAAPVSDEPKAVPATRPQIKEALEKLKERSPRLPVQLGESTSSSDGRIVVYNGRARSLYLPSSWFAADFKTDGAMTLDYPFKTRLFWIVSRGNNCHYCLGHQEHKLAAVGMSDDEIAALDSDWSRFPAREQAAMRLTRKMTLEPHAIFSTDVDELRSHFSNAEIIELVYTIAFYNSVNRWTDSLGLPQDQKFRDTPIHFDAPTSAQFLNTISNAAPTSKMKRPPLESPAEVDAALAAARKRQPRVALPSKDQARQAMASVWDSENMPQWVVALAQFPETGSRQVAALKAIATEGDLDDKLKFQLARISARHNRAWYALGHMNAMLRKLGMSDEQIQALDGSLAEFTPAEQEAFKFARKLTATSWQMSDADIARLRKHYTDRQVAQIVYVVCAANFLDRFTETLGLQLEGEAN